LRGKIDCAGLRDSSWNLPPLYNPTNPAQKELNREANADFGQVDEKFCEGFKTFLATVKSRKSEHSRLSENTKYTYFNKFRACVKEAFEDKLFVFNPILRVKGVPQGESHREFLTLEKLKAVYQMECEHPVLKRAAIFSARYFCVNSKITAR